MDDSLSRLTKTIRDFCNARDWKQFHNPKDLAISISLEAAEVLDLFQWKSPQEIQEYLKYHKSGLADELVDVLYFVLLMADRSDIDLAEAFEAKMKKNEKKYPVNKARGNHKKHTEL
jgi:NTP pyrophosphatase (non-canonical NTP hydrolase)